MILELYHIYVEKDKADVVTIVDREKSRLISAIWQGQTLSAIKTMDRTLPEKMNKMHIGYRDTNVKEEEFDRIYEFIKKQLNSRLNGPIEILRLTSERQKLPEFLYPPKKEMN